MMNTIRTAGDGKWHMYPEETPPCDGSYLITIEYRGGDREVERWYYEDGTWFIDLDDNQIYVKSGYGTLLAWAEEVLPFGGN